MPINLDLCKKKSPVMMRYENKRCCIALVHDYGREISGLVVVKSASGKIFNSPHFSLKLEDLKSVSGAGYKIKVGKRTETIPSRIVNRFVADVQKEILRHRQDGRRKRKNRK